MDREICCSRFRPPDVEIVEHECRRVWPDWDDYPPGMGKKIPEPIPEATPSERQTQGRIRQTKEEIDEIMKRFPRGSEPDSFIAPASNTPFEPTTFFRQKQPMPESSTFQRRMRTSSPGGFDYTSLPKSFSPEIHIPSPTSFRSDPPQFDSPFTEPHVSPTNSKPFTATPNSPPFDYGRFASTSPRFDQTPPRFKSPEIPSNGSRIDYDRLAYPGTPSVSSIGADLEPELVLTKPDPINMRITAAETLEARVLRKQNESMRNTLKLSMEKLEQIKAENKRLLAEIEKIEAERREYQRQQHNLNSSS